MCMADSILLNLIIKILSIQSTKNQNISNISSYSVVVLEQWFSILLVSWPTFIRTSM